MLATTSREIPDYPLTDYVNQELAEAGIYVNKFEVINSNMDRPAGMHRHSHFELFWLRGPAEHFNDFEHFDIPGDRPSFVLVSPGQLHRWVGADDLRGTLISFTTAFFDGREPPPSRLMQLGFVNRMTHPPVLVADAQLERELAALIERCEVEYEHRTGPWQEMIRHALHMILLLAERAWSRQETLAARDGHRGRELLLQFQTAVEAGFKEQWSVATYAKKLGVTAGHLNDVVRQLTARTASELIQSRELLEARRLLTHSSLSVSEIAYELGYKDPSYFSRVFRRATQLSPAEFRGQIHENYRSTPE